jgi:Spy/CpxP family protein refolding chaperone
MVWISIAILGVLNILLLGYFFLSPSSREHEPPPFARDGHEKPRGPFGMIVEQTNMDEQQIAQYEKLRDEHRDAVSSIRKEMAEQRQVVYSSLGTITNEQQQEVLNTLASGQRKIDSVTIEHFKTVRKILRPEQVTRFDSIMPEAIQMMSPRR